MPSGDYFADPGTFTMMGYLLLFEHIGLDYTLSTYAAEGGNFGWFISHEMGKRLNAKIYHEAKRLGVKWILGGECGHMWRVCNQYMPTWWEGASFLEQPKSPITGTVFENAAVHKMVHISEFTADLIHHNKLKLDPQRNAHIKLTFHDSCNTARGMGIFEEPRYIINNVMPEGHFFEMPPNTIREKTFCCGSSSGINANENMEAPDARRLPPGQRREVCPGQIRGEPPGLHLRPGPGHPAHPDELLGAGYGGHRHHRAGGQRPGL